jgi:ribosomal protein L29
MKNFVSIYHPEMNYFFLRLQKALGNLPENPRPECEGFYFADFDPQKGLTAEEIGEAVAEKKSKYLHFACKKATEVLRYKAKRSKEFADDKAERYAGSFASSYGCTGISGHDSMIDEAIAVLCEATKHVIRVNDSTNAFLASDEFFRSLRAIALTWSENYVPDNKWVDIIANLMADQQ